MNESIKLKVKINRARFSLLFFVILSIINIWTISAGKSLLMPFSSSIATYSTLFGISASIQTGNSAIRIFGLIMAGTIVFLTFLCYARSKAKPLYFVVAFSLLIADTFALIVIAIISSTIFSFLVLLDIFTHILIIFYSLSAIKSNRLLDKMKNEENKSDDTAESTSDLLQYDYDGTEPLLQTENDKLEIFIFEKDESYILVVNGYICGVSECHKSKESTIQATVNGNDILFKSEHYNGSVCRELYLNDKLVDRNITS